VAATPFGLKLFFLCDAATDADGHRGPGAAAGMRETWRNLMLVAGGGGGGDARLPFRNVDGCEPMAAGAPNCWWKSLMLALAGGVVCAADYVSGPNGTLMKFMRRTADFNRIWA